MVDSVVRSPADRARGIRAVSSDEHEGRKTLLPYAESVKMDCEDEMAQTIVPGAMTAPFGTTTIPPRMT
jgi:hypothetical protein